MVSDREGELRKFRRVELLEVENDALRMQLKWAIEEAAIWKGRWAEAMRQIPLVHAGRVLNPFTKALEPWPLTWQPQDVCSSQRSR